MRISAIFIMVSFFSGITIVKGQPSQMLLPLQKPVAHPFTLPASPAFSLRQATDSSKVTAPKNFLPLNFYSTHVGAMCKMELKLEKGTKLPLRIRLGSKDQVDYLEGKKNQ